MDSVALVARPALHAVHSTDSRLAANVPAGHASHRAWPARAWYLPRAHAWHWVCEVAFWTRPGGHLSHPVLRPVTLLKVPCGHSLHNFCPCNG